MLDSMYKTMSISSGLYPNLDLWNANKLQLQLQSILGTIFFLNYINDLLKLATIGTQNLLYANDTSIIVTSPNLENFETQ